MGIIIDGKELASIYEEKAKKNVLKLKERFIEPTLAVLLIGNDEASKIYVRNKKTACERVGIKFKDILLNEDISEDDLLELIKELNEDNNIHGILIQSPIPKHIDFNKCCSKINEKKDVDGFNPINIGKLLLNEKGFIPCTVLAIWEILKSKGIDIDGKNVTIIGRSNIVGKPLANFLLNHDATVTICHSKTENLIKYTQNADIIISATGKANLIKEYMVKESSIVIDVGISRIDGRLCGDVDFEKIKNKVKYITPVPGGVGPMTIAMLLNNVIKAANEIEGEESGY